MGRKTDEFRVGPLDVEWTPLQPDFQIDRRQRSARRHLDGIQKAILDVAAKLKTGYHPLKHLIEV